jgi:hypothetical protein
MGLVGALEILNFVLQPRPSVQASRSRRTHSTVPHRFTLARNSIPMIYPDRARIAVPPNKSTRNSRPSTLL